MEARDIKPTAMGSANQYHEDIHGKNITQGIDTHQVRVRNTLHTF